MREEIHDLIDRYLSWLKDKTIISSAPNEWTEITTPFLDRHNDYIQIYVKRKNGDFVLTDDGYTIDDLQQSGCNLESSKRQDLLKMTLAGFGVSNKSGSLEVMATYESFPQKKHSLLQAMLAVNDLFYLATPVIASLFFEDVVSWLEQNDIRHTPRVKFTGKSGYDNLFDFVIPKSRRQPERVIQTITRPSREAAESLAFKWIDIRDVRSPDAKAFAFLNDQEKSVPYGVAEALKNYEVTPVPWSERESVREELVA